MRETILLFTSYEEKYSKLSDEQFGQLMRAAISYQKTGEVPEIEDITVSVAFDTAKFDIDLNNQKYDELVEKRKDAGRKGGLAKASKSSKAKQSLANGSKAKQSLAKPSLHEHEHVHDNNNIVNKSNSLHSLDCINSSETSSDNSEPTEEEKYNQLVKELKAKAEDGKVDEVINEYKLVCTDLPTIQKVTKERRQKVKARLKTFSTAEIFKCFNMVAESDFLSGRAGTWQASFDWLFANDKNIQKVLEGNYQNKSPTKKGFNNFEQRDYDFAALEQKLLGG